MRKAGVFIAIAAFAAVMCSCAARRGFRHAPRAVSYRLAALIFRFHRHPLYMRANRHDVARSEAGQGVTRRCFIRTSLCRRSSKRSSLPTMRRPGRSAMSAFFRPPSPELPASEDRRLCQPSVDANAIVTRVRAEVTPSGEQMQPLQKLGGALGAAVRLPGQSMPGRDSGAARCAAAADGVADRGADHGDRYRSPAAAGFRAIAQRRPESEVRGRRGIAAGAVTTCRSPGSVHRDRAVLRRIAHRNRLDDRSDRQIGAADRRAAAGPDRCQAGLRQSATTICKRIVRRRWPPTAVGRLDAIEARLDATWRSVLSIQVALANFETKLNDAQKDRFDQMNFAAR